MLCPMCGLEAGDGNEICPYHLSEDRDDWSEGNRTMSDFLHRRKVKKWGKKHPKPEPEPVLVVEP